MDLDRLSRDPLPFDLGDRRDGELIRDGADAEKRVDAQRLVDPLARAERAMSASPMP